MNINTRHLCTEGGGGGVWGFKPLPPEIPKCLQSWAEFAVLWKIHPLQRNKNMGFTHLHIERNTWLGGYCPHIPVLPVLCPQLNLLNPPPNKIPGYTTDTRSCIFNFLLFGSNWNFLVRRKKFNFSLRIFVLVFLVTAVLGGRNSPSLAPLPSQLLPCLVLIVCHI
jgi:hypothetical protein